MSVSPDIAAQLEPQVSVDDVLLKFAKVSLERDWYKERLAQVLTANQTLVRAASAPAEMPTPIQPLSEAAFTEDAITEVAAAMNGHAPVKKRA